VAVVAIGSAFSAAADSRPTRPAIEGLTPVGGALGVVGYSTGEDDPTTGYRVVVDINRQRIGLLTGGGFEADGTTIDQPTGTTLGL